MRRSPAVVLAATCALAAVVLAPVVARVLPSTSDEVRGLWVVRSSLTSSASVSRMIEGARAAGFNALFLQVRGRGDAYYNGGVEPRADLLAAADPAFDPLAFTLARAHAADIRVHAWVTMNLVASAHDLPKSPSHIANRSPSWLMVPRSLAQELSTADPHSPGYLGRLARWSRARSTEVEGLYLSPVHAGAARHNLAVISDLLRRYALDGIHLDYVRYPSADFDFSRATLEEFRANVRPDLTPAEDRRLETEWRSDVLAYVDMFPQRWASFRRARLTALIVRVRDAVHSIRPGAVLSAAVVPEIDEAVGTKLQEWPRWLETGLLDAACPMAYTPDDTQFVSQVTAAVGVPRAGAIWAGIGAYRLTPEQTVDRIASARGLGADGVVLFSYDSIVQSTQPATYLVDVGRRAFVDARATTGSR